MRKSVVAPDADANTDCGSYRHDDIFDLTGIAATSFVTSYRNEISHMKRLLMQYVKRILLQTRTHTMTSYVYSYLDSRAYYTVMTLRSSVLLNITS